jgi:hypothetical protein
MPRPDMVKLVGLDPARQTKVGLEMRFKTGTLTKIVAVAAFVCATSAHASAPQVVAPQAADRADLLLAPAAAKPVQSQVPPVINDGEAYHRADDARQDPEELRTTQALNAEIASRNDLAENQERADQAAFEAERARYEEAVTKAAAAQLAYEEDLRRTEAARRQWEADHARWQADVRACETGDRTRCAPVPN